MTSLKDHLHPAAARRAGQELARRALHAHVRLAVTGLSHSGKTVFITSLVNQIQRLSQTTGLPFLDVSVSERVAGARLLPHPDIRLPTFAYDEHLRNLMRTPPQWPQGTDGISQIRAAIRFRPANRISARVTGLRTLYVDIIDYPGEWLLDFALLEKDYDAWSQQVFNQCEEEPRRSLSHHWRSFLTSLPLDQTDETDSTQRAALLYSNFLHRSKASGLSFLQPGRFTMPGELKGSALLSFCPLPPGSRHTALSGLHAIMAERYEAYKTQVVRRFYEDHFLSFDRQIVLVDLLKALNAGYRSFRDMQDSLIALLRCFRYGRRGGLMRSLRPHIDRLLFAVTKVDCVAPGQHANLRELLKSMMSESDNEARFEGVITDTLTTSSIQSAHSIERNHQGRVLACVRGVPKGQSEEIDVFPGEVPNRIPAPRDWTEGRFDFPDFSPPPLHDIRSRGIPHIRLDQAIEFLIGDKLQ